MPNNKQDTVDTLYVKYQRTLELLSNAIDENEIKDKTIAQLKQELDAKPKEVEVEKVVEITVDTPVETTVQEGVSVLVTSTAPAS